MNYFEELALEIEKRHPKIEYKGVEINLTPFQYMLTHLGDLAERVFNILNGATINIMKDNQGFLISKDERVLVWKRDRTPYYNVEEFSTETLNHESNDISFVIGEFFAYYFGGENIGSYGLPIHFKKNLIQIEELDKNNLNHLLIKNVDGSILNLNPLNVTHSGMYLTKVGSSVIWSCLQPFSVSQRLCYDLGDYEGIEKKLLEHFRIESNWAGFSHPAAAFSGFLCRFLKDVMRIESPYIIHVNRDNKISK
ncbi:hypothetical protein ACFS6H_20005 [Terrimonas rubra]|uniref:Uncharacterized protein n=1 Tax=Terrimonas rubra TaxID=1035890 RepID=A0ABW6ABZ8_9BACT